MLRAIFFFLLCGVVSATDLVPCGQHVAKVQSHYNIRILILKHCPDSIADGDAREAVQAANLAKSKGLTIETIGNYRVNKDGKTNRAMWGGKLSYSDLEGLTRFISEQMKIGAKQGDTFIVYTIGHGSGNGSIMRLGQRKVVMEAIAKAAEENDQETFWWQLSCHAGAHLPAISTLNEKQQELFSMIASSPANELSWFKTQGARMKKIFNALATNDPEIDPDQDETVTAGELADFVSKRIGEKFGKLVFAKDRDKPIFGWFGRLANSIPIVDRNGGRGEYPRDYIPMPRKR
jgi:hypothetical protein